MTYAPTPQPSPLPTPLPSPLPTEAPEIFNISLPAGATGLPTQGGTTVTLTGEDFGSFDRFNNGGDSVTVTYGVTGTEYTALNCTMTVEHTEIVCVTAPGVGTGLRFRVQHTGVASQLSSGTISYFAPEVVAVTPDYATTPSGATAGDLTGFNTAGGQTVMLTGANFGPSGTAVEAFYRLPDGGGFDGGYTLRGSVFEAANCSLATPHTSVVCVTSPGVGAGHVWFLVVGNQTGAAPESNSTRYASPSLTGLARVDGGSMDQLDTRGAQNVTLSGANFGPVAANNVPNVSYEIPDLSTAERSALGLAGDTFEAVSCAVTTADVEMVCQVAAGVGTGHVWSLEVGRQAQHAATSATLSSSYSPAELTEWGPAATAAYLDTKGGEVLTFYGDFFGPVGATNLVSAFYSNPALSDLASGPFAALSCSVTTAHTAISCTTEEGVGYSHSWNVTVGGQGMSDASAGVLLTSYRSPTLTLVTADTVSGMFATGGGEYAYLTGFNFGPPANSTPSNTASATYGKPSLAGLGMDLVGDTYTATACEVLSFTSARCKSAEGLGYHQAWTFTVGGQTWAEASNSSAPYVNASRVQTSYHPPALLFLEGPSGVQSSADLWPPVLLLAAGGEDVVLNGTNFGPASASNTLAVSYSNPSLPGLAGSTFDPTCSVTIPHFQITCQTATGVGFNHTWKVSVGNQSLVADGAAAVTSYSAPEITELDSVAVSDGIATEGTSVVTLTGVNFGPAGVPSNGVTAAYASVLETLNPNTLAAASFAVNCTVTVADTEAQCQTLPGVGKAQAWVLTVGGQDSAQSTGVSHYKAPEVTTVAIDGASTLATSGGNVVRLSGSNFGPAGDPANDVTALYRTLRSELANLGPGVVVGTSLETTDFAASQCNVTAAHTEITCWSVAGVGQNLRFLATVGGQVSNASTGTLNYTAPTILGVDSASAVARTLDPADGTTVTALEFGTPGGYAVTVTGTSFGPVNSTNTISVRLANAELGLGDGLNNDGFGSALAGEFQLVECSVTDADTQATCTVPPAVGRLHTWAITVGSQESSAAANFTSSFTPPTLTGLAVVTDAVAGDKGFDTLGGVDVVELTGTNLGPGGNNRVYATTLSSTCQGCSVTSLVYSVAGQSGANANRTTYNFAADSCEVVTNHTVMRCVVGPGVGQNHTWQAFVGGQPSSPLLTAQTAYANPSLQKLNPITGPVVAESAAGAVTVTLHGRYFGTSDLCKAQVYLEVEEQTPESSGSGFVYLYTSVTLNVTTPLLNHTDDQVAFSLPDLDGDRVLTDKSQTAWISVKLAGVETASDARVPFRYFEAQNVDPFSAPVTEDATCVTDPNVTVYGTGFITDAEYASTFSSYHYGSTGVNPSALLQLGDEQLTCQALDSTRLNCPNTPGYTGSDVAVGGVVTLTPQVSLTGGEEWMTGCAAPVASHLEQYLNQPDFPVDAGCTFGYYSLPGVTSISPATGPLGGNTTVTVVGEFFDANSGLLFAVFGVSGQAEYVQCSVVSASQAECPSPKFIGSASSLGGSLVEVQVQLDEDFVDQRICLSGAGANSSFYYHPSTLTSSGPYPPLLSLTGSSEQSLLLDASPFLDEGSLTFSSDLSASLDLFRVSNSEDVVAATREEHRAVNVSFAQHLNLLPLDQGESLLVEVVVDTATEVAAGAMASDCTDINLWLSDQTTALSYWMQPDACGDSDTTLVVTLPGPLTTASLDASSNLQLFASFGSEVTSTYMDGASVFELSDGYITHSGGAAHDDTAWRYPGSATSSSTANVGLQQQQVDKYRYRAYANYGGVSGFTQHQYKGNWSYLVMTESVASYSPDLRLDVRWDAPLAGGGSDYVFYFSESGSMPFVPSDDGWVGESTLFVTIGTGPAGGTGASDSLGPELRVWGSDPDARVFANSSFCTAAVDAAGTAWPQLLSGVEATFTLGTDLADASTSSLSVRVNLAGTLVSYYANPDLTSNVTTLANSTSVDYGWVDCAPLAGFGARVWGAEGADTFRFPSSDGGSKAATQESADLAAGSWNYTSMPSMKLHVGVDQRSNVTTLGADAANSDVHGWANAHTWLTLTSTATSNGTAVATAATGTPSMTSRPSGTVDSASRDWWRLRFTTSNRPSTAQAHDVSASFNGQGGLSADATTDLRQFTSSLAQGYGYAPPPQGGIWPEVLDLTSYDLHDDSLNVTVWSPAISDAVAALVAAGDATAGQLSWEDLPLNLNSFSDATVASPGLSTDAAASVEIVLAVGSFEGAPCVPSVTADVGVMGAAGSGEAAVLCSLAGARKEQLMDSSYGENLVRVSFNGGVTYNALPGANLTAYTIGTNFTSSLVGSMYGGTQIAGSVGVETAGAYRDFVLGNSSLVLVGETGGSQVELPFDAPGGELSDAFDGNGVDSEWSSSSSVSSSFLKFNVTLPHTEGVYARDTATAPTPAPTMLNATKPPTPLPVTCSNDDATDAVTCPPDSALNCTFCPSARLREGAWYPCYRPSSLSGVTGRCLPPKDAAVRFSAGESVSLYVSTALSANGVPLTTGQGTTSSGSETAWAARSLSLATFGGLSVLDTGHSLTAYDPATLIESMDPLGAASVRRASDEATSITFSGTDLNTAMTPQLHLEYTSGTVSGAFEDQGSAQTLTGELAASNGYYPRIPSEFPRKSDLSVDETAETLLLLRQPTRLQSVYLASDLTDAYFNAGDSLHSAYFKLSGKLRGNLYNVRLRIGASNRTQVAASASFTGSDWATTLLAPVSDDELTLVSGPTALSVGDMEANQGLYDAADDTDPAGQWIRLTFDKAFVWDGTSNLVLDLSYSVTPWGQGVKSQTYLSVAGPSANMLLRATYGSYRTAVTLGSPDNTPSVYEFVPCLRFGTSSQVVIEHNLFVEFPTGVSATSLDMSVDLTVNGQPQSFLGAETSRLVPGSVMYLNVSSDAAAVALLESDPAAQADLKAVIASSLASAQSLVTVDNIVLVNVGGAVPDQSSSSSSSSSRRQLLSSGSAASTVVEFKVVSSDSFTMSESAGEKLHSQLLASAADGTLASGLAATTSLAGSTFDTVASSTVTAVAGNSTDSSFLASGDVGFTLFNPQTITMGSLTPALSSVAGGTVVTISGSGFFAPTTSDGLVVVRWTVLNRDVWLTSYGTVGGCAGAGSTECTEIYTTAPAADASFVSSGTTTVYVVVSFNGVTFTSESYISYLVYYKTPKLNSFYMLDLYPTTVPHATQELLGASTYRTTMLMPQSGKQFNTNLNAEVQLYIYMNASDLYLTSSTTVCVFLFDGTGDDSLDDFANCVDEERCVLSDADLVYTDTAFEGGPGFTYISGGTFYSQVEFACEVPATTAGPVRVALSANGFSGNELADHPTGTFRETQGVVVTSYGCSPGEYASSPNIACRSCPAGKKAELDGTSCSDCPRRTYQPDEGSIACLDCPLNTDTNTTGVKTLTQCTCTEGFYALGGVGGQECSSCVDNAVCPGGRDPPYPIEGFYRDISVTTDDSTAARRLATTTAIKLKSCSPPTACTGGPDNACHEGYEGVKCSSCEVGYFRLSHYCTECPDPTLVSFILPVQLLMFTFSLLVLTLAFDTVSRYATMSIFVRSAQLLFVSSYYEVAWSGSFSHYYRHSNGVLTNVERDVYPISFFPIFKVLNYFGPLVYFPMFETTSAPGCPNDRHVDWAGVVDGFFRSSYFSLDSLGGWVIAFVVFLEIVCHGRSHFFLRVRQRLVAIVSTCLPAACTYMVRYVICDLGSSTGGTCTASTAESKFVLLVLVGGFAFVCSTFYGVAMAEAGTSKANLGPWCFLTRNKKVKYAGYEAWLQLRSVLLVAVTVLTNNGVFQAGLALCMLLLSLIFQVLHHPYKNTYANMLELISTAALVVVSFVGMVGSIGQLDMHIIADALRNAGYVLVFATTILALYVIVGEVAESRAITAKEARYTRVSLGLQQPSVAELAKEKDLESLVGFVREVVQAMLQGDMAGNSGVRGVGACPFPDEQIAQLLNASDLLYSVTMMRHTMFRSFVLSETKGFFRRIVTHPEVSRSLEAAMLKKVSTRLGPSKAERKRALKEAMEKHKQELAEQGRKESTSAKLIGKVGHQLNKLSVEATTPRVKKEVKRTTRSLRTVLFRLIDKVSRALTARMLEPPPVLLALKGLDAYTEWGSKTGAAKVSQEMWNRIHKLFLRRLEPFPMGVRKALHCADEESFGSHYIQPWIALLGPIAETQLDTWFTVSGAGSGREVKAKMLDCIFDPEQKVAFTVEVLQRLRSLLVTEPSTQHSYVIGVMKHGNKGLLSKIAGGGGSGNGGLDDLKSVKGGSIVEMRIELSNCYRDKTDPKLGGDGWSVRLLRYREMRARHVKEIAASSAKPIVLHDENFQATMNGGSAKNAKLFNVFAEGWSCSPAGGVSGAPTLQLDLGRVTRIAALSLQGGSIFALAPVHSKPAEVPKEAVYAIKAAVDALDRQILIVKETIFKAKPKAEQKKLKEESGDEETKKGDTAATGYWVEDGELPNGYRQAVGEAKALRVAAAAMEGKAAEAYSSKARSNTKLSHVTEESSDDDDDDDEMDELDLDAEEETDPKSHESAEAEKRIRTAFKKLTKLLKFQGEAKAGSKAARAAAKKMAAEAKAEAGKDKKARAIANQISMDETSVEVAGIANVVDTEVGVYVPFALGLLHQVRGNYERSQRELQTSLEKLDLLNLRRPAAMGGVGSSSADAAPSSPSGGLLGALGFGGINKANIKDDPTLALDPDRERRCDVLRAVIFQQLAAAKWGSYQVHVGLNNLKASEGQVGRRAARKRLGQGSAKSIFANANDNLRDSLSPTDRRDSDFGEDEEWTPEFGPVDGATKKKSRQSGDAATMYKGHSLDNYDEDEDLYSDDEEEEGENAGYGSQFPTEQLQHVMSTAQRASFIEMQVQSAIVSVLGCIEAYGTAVKLNPYSYACQTGLSAAQEELRRLRGQEEEASAIDPLLAGGDLAMRKLMLAKEAAKANDHNRHVLAAGPQDETMEISSAFVNPAWVTKFSVEFSKDKVHWHSTSDIDGVHDPEMVQRLYLPPPPVADKTTGVVPADKYEARYLRFKPFMDLSEKAQRARKKRGRGRGEGGDGSVSWQHHVAMRVGVEELASRAADEEVVFASAAGWRDDKPEEYEVKFLRRSLGIRLSEDPIRLNGDMGACPVVAVVAEGKPWPRVGDLLVAVGSEPVRGTTLTLITAAIMEGRRPLTLRFMPREKWFQDIEEASYDLVYPVDQLGIQIAVNPETGLPTVISQPSTPMHVSNGEADASKPDIEDQVVGVKKVGESKFEMLLSHADPYQRMIDLVTTGGRPITLKYLPPLSRREEVRLQKHSHALEQMQLRQLGVPSGGGGAAAGGPSPLGGGDGGGARSAELPGLPSGGAPKAKPKVRLERFEVTFTEPSLGLGLQCGENEDDLPIVSSAPPGLARPGVGDVMETVGGEKLIGSADAYSRAIELITGGGRPITVGFVALPTTTYDLEFDAPRLGISLVDRENQVPLVEANSSGRTQPSIGDRLVAVNGEKLENKLDAYQWAINKIKTGGRPLTLTFETAMEGAQAAAVLKALAKKELAKGDASGGGGGGGGGTPSSKPAVETQSPMPMLSRLGGSGAPAQEVDDRSQSTTPLSHLFQRKVSMEEVRDSLMSQDRPPPSSRDDTNDDFGAPSVVELDLSDVESLGGASDSDDDDDGDDFAAGGGGGGLSALWASRSALKGNARGKNSSKSNEGKKKKKKKKRKGAAAAGFISSSSDADESPHGVSGGAPASEIADADAEYKEVVFRGPKLGLDLLGGATTGHLPVLGSPLQAESADPPAKSGGGGLFSKSSKKGEQVMLEVGDQLVAVGGTSLIDAEDPFERAVELIKGHTARPVTLRFMAAATPGPFSVKFQTENLGIAIEANASDPRGFPVVWNTDGNAAQGPYPRVGDSVIGVDGSALSHPTDKLAEAASLIRGSPRPLRVLFQPAYDHGAAHAAHLAAQQAAAAASADAAPPAVGAAAGARMYDLTYPNPSLGIALLDEGAGQAPVVESLSSDGGATPQGSVRMPLPGHKLVAVNGKSVVGGSVGTQQHPYDVAVGLIKGSPRPVVLSFQPPPVYALEFPEKKLGISLEDTSATHGLPSILAGGCAVSPSLPLTGDVVVKVNDTEIDPSHPSESTYDQAVRLITSSPRPLTVVFAEPPDAVAPPPVAAGGAAGVGSDVGGESVERFEVVFEGEKLGIGLQAGDEPTDLPVVSSSPPGRPRPTPGDFLESVNGIMLLGEADPYAYAIDLITSSGRPLVLGFVAFPGSSSPDAPSVLSVTAVSEPPAALAQSDGSYEVVFEGERLGMGILAAEDLKNFPIVSSPPADKELPKEGHLIVSVNGYNLSGSPDCYSKAVELISSSGRPVIIGFKTPPPEPAAPAPAAAAAAVEPPPPATVPAISLPPPPAADPSAPYETVFRKPKLGLGLTAGEVSTDLPVVSSAPKELDPGERVPAEGDLLRAVNGVSLAGAPDAYEKAIELITTSGRPITLGFLPARSEAETKAMMPGSTYEVVFEGEKLGMGIVAAEDLRDFPSVSRAPAGKELPKEGHLIVSVNGYNLSGSPDCYSKAVEVITTAGRPVIIGFKVPFTEGGDESGDGAAGAALLASGGGMAGMEHLTPSERVHALFDLLDTNKDGVLTKSEVIGGAPQLKMSLFDAANLFDQLDINKDGVLERAEFVSLVPGARDEELKKMPKAKRKTLAAAPEGGALAAGLMSVLGLANDNEGGAAAEPDPSGPRRGPSASSASLSDEPSVKPRVPGGLRTRPKFKASDVALKDDGSYTVTFRGGKGKGPLALPPLGFKLAEAPKRAMAPRVDVGGYEAVEPSPHKKPNGKANSSVTGWPLAGHQIVAVEGSPVELDGVQDCFARCVKLLEDACSGSSSKSLTPVGCVVVTFRPPPEGEAAAAAASAFLDDDDEDGGAGGGSSADAALGLRPGLADGEESEEESADAGLWAGEEGGFGGVPMEVELDDGMYAVQFSTKELHMKLMENVDRRNLPVVAKAFPGATLMQRGHLLMSVNNRAVDDKRSQKHEPFATALDFLAALKSPPVTLEFMRPPSVAKITAVEGSPGLYDAEFEGESLGIELSSFGRQGRVVRIVGTHPIGVPHLGDQVVAVNGVSLLGLADRIEQGTLTVQDGKKTKDVLSYVQWVVGDLAARPITLRLQRSTGEMAAGEEMAEARRGFSVLFMSSSLGLGFDLKTGVPVVDDVRPVFTAPRQGDVLTAINGAELSKCALTVGQLALMLKALPRPLRLSFVDGSKALQDALKSTSARAEGSLAYPSHHLRQVLVPAGRKIGLKLMTISSRPVVQAVVSKALQEQGMLPSDVIVTIDGKHVGDVSAVECAKMLSEARQAALEETAQASRASRVKRTRAIKLGVLRMAPMDKNSSYNSQHPIDVAAALTNYDFNSKIGLLSFSMPHNIPSDKYKVEVYRYGSQVAPMMSGGSHERDHYIRYTRSLGVDLQQTGGRFAASKKK